MSSTVDIVSSPEELLRSLLASSGDCIKILDLAGNLVFMTEGGQRIMEVKDFSAIKGCPWPDFWQGAGNAHAIAAVATAKVGGRGHFEGFATTMAGTPKWWDVTVSPVFGPDGAVQAILSVSRDITASRAAQIELRESEMRAAAAVEAADIGTWDFDPQNGVLRWDRRCYELFGLTPGTPIDFSIFLAGVHPDDREATDAACRYAMLPDGTRSYDIEYRTIGFEDGIERWCSAKGRCEFDGREPTRFIGTIRDISDFKHVEAQRNLLNFELEHRMKNTMAMVSAIAGQTFRTATSLQEARPIFEGRLQALNQAHDILVRSSWTKTSMMVVAQGALRPHGSTDGRIAISGPDIELTAKQALSLALALHELATNATKYGALSTGAGTVSVLWDYHVTAEGARLRFIWKEKGGPVVEQPSRRGFGSRLIERTLAADFGGSVVIDYDPSGLICSFDTKWVEPPVAAE